MRAMVAGTSDATRDVMSGATAATSPKVMATAMNVASSNNLKKTTVPAVVAEPPAEL